MTHRCVDCRYSASAGDWIECRRHPPVVTTVVLTDREGTTSTETTTNWPEVLADEWCGEFRANLRPRPAG